MYSRSLGSGPGCGAIGLVFLLIVAINALFYWLAYQVAEALGVAGWIGIALLVLIEFAIGSARASSK